MIYLQIMVLVLAVWIVLGVFATAHAIGYMRGMKHATQVLRERARGEGRNNG